MSDLLSAANDAIRRASPALFRSLSPLGREVVYPPDIPFQAQQARGKPYNATIGQITDGQNRVLALPSVEELLGSLPEEDRNRGLLYSPVEGIGELREAWRSWHRPESAPPSTLPVVTAGLSHGLSLAADLFGGPGKAVAVPVPYWGNYRQIFAVRTGAEILTAPAYRDGRYNCTAVAEALIDLPKGEPAVAILNLPSNPGGYSPTSRERQLLVESLLEVAESRPLIVVCDDAYAGEVYEEGVPKESIFWELAARHDHLVPIKVDGATKEFFLFGGRVGFVTFPFERDSAIAESLESKVKCLIRATIGSPVALGQVVLLGMLRRETVVDELASNLAILKARYVTLKRALEGVDPELLRPLPFNSGAFALLELPQGVDPEEVRRHLLETQGTGVVAIPPAYLRIAFCSVEEGALAELVRRIERGVADFLRCRSGSA